MSPPLIRYELDPTGINPDNYVNSEPHVINTELNIRALAPTYGAYFTESLKIYDNATNTLLTRGTQYLCTELVDFATEIYAKEVCYLILITDRMVSSNIKISYQALGGPYTRSADAIINIYNNFQIDDRPVNWPDIINKPTTFAPGPHLHDIGDVYGFEYLIPPLERIKDAIVLSNVPAFEKILTYISDEIKLFKQTVNSRINQITTVNINDFALVTQLTNGIMSSADKTALDNLKGALTNTVKQYITAPDKQNTYSNELSFTSGSTGILFCIASLQVSRTNDVNFNHSILLNDVQIDSDQTRNPTQQRIAKIVQGNVLQKITQTVKASNDGSIDSPSAISFGFSYIFIPTVAASILPTAPPVTTPPPTTQPPVTTQPPATTAPPVTTQPPVTTTAPPVTTQPPATTASPTPSATTPRLTFSQNTFSTTQLTTGVQASIVATTFINGPINGNTVTGTLPPGTTLVVRSGDITLEGTPTTAGTYTSQTTFNSNNGSQTLTFNATVALAPFTITPTSRTVNITQGASSAPLIANFANGTIVDTSYTLSSFAPGMGLAVDNSAKTISISGVPTTVGTYNTLVTILSTNGNATINLTMVVAAAVTTPPATTPPATQAPFVITSPIDQLLNLFVNTNYVTPIGNFSNGNILTTTYTGTLPPGMAIVVNNTDKQIKLNGTPTTAGTFTSVITIYSDNGTATIRLTVNALAATTTQPPVTTAAPRFTLSTNAVSTTLNVNENYPYNSIILATYANGIVIGDSNFSGSYPPGITLAFDGDRVILVGTPTTPGTYTSSRNITSTNGSQLLTIVVIVNGQTTTQPPATTPPATQAPMIFSQNSFSTTLTAGVPLPNNSLVLTTFTGGPITGVAGATGSQPTGTTFNYRTGVLELQGTPTVPGNYTYQATFISANGNQSISVNITVNPAATTQPTTPFMFINDEHYFNPTTVFGQYYSGRIAGYTGGPTPSSFRVTSGALPPGTTITWDASNVYLSGSVTGNVNNYQPTVELLDQNGAVISYMILAIYIV